MHTLITYTFNVYDVNKKFFNFIKNDLYRFSFTSPCMYLNIMLCKNK